MVALEVFDAANETIIAPVFRADLVPDGKALDVPTLIDGLVQRGLKARTLPDAATIASTIVAEAQAGDVVMVMSNGGFDGMHDLLLNALEARDERSSTVAP